MTARADTPPAEVRLDRDVVFGKDAGEDLKLDIARPATDAKRLPCVVFIHGGGWSSGSRAAHDDDVRRMAQNGYVAATVDYRLAPKHRFPAQVHDVKCAIRYLRAHADEHGLDPERIAVWGISSGAHLALMLGVTQKEDGLEGDGGWAEHSSAVQGVVAFYPRTDLAASDMPAALRQVHVDFLGGTVDEVPDQYRKASPVSYVTPGDAPTLIFQGTKDPRVPLTQTMRMLDAMTKAGVPGRAELIAGAGHGWEGAERARTTQSAEAFIAGILASRPPSAQR